MRPSHGRAERLERVLEESISAMLLKGIKDPRASGVTVTGVAVTPDLRRATIYIATSRRAKNAEQEALAGLRSSIGFMRTELGHELRLRYTPELEVELDRSLDEAERIETIIAQLRRQETGGQSDQPQDDDTAGKTRG